MKEKVEIHTDEFEKFNIIRKASLKHVLLNFINIIILLFPQYLITFGGTDAHFLANSLSLGVLLQLTIFAIHEFIGIASFLVFSIKGGRNLYKGEKVSYDFTASVAIRKVIYKIMSVITLLVLIVIALEHDFNMLGFLILFLLLAAIFNYIISLVKNKNYKNNKIIVTISYVLLSLVIFIISIGILNNIIFSRLLKENNNYEYSEIENEKILTLEDFGDKNLEGNSYVSSRKSSIASYMLYLNEGEKIHLSYSLFESKFEWLVKYNFDKVWAFKDKIEVDYIEKKTNLPEDIKVYMNEHGHHYIIISPNKMIEISTIDGLSEDELINIVYEKIFK